MMNMIGAVVMWWILAGICIRLGVFPIDFFRWVASRLGLGNEAPVPGARRLPGQDVSSGGAR